MLKSGNLCAHKVDSPKELYDLWPKVRDGLNTIEKRCKGVFYRPEDVYYAIKTNTATLFSCTINHVYVGFFIVRLDSHPDGNCLHFWTLHHLGNNADFTENVFAIVAQLKELLGCVRVSFSSSRKGWVKLAEKLGYHPVATLHYFESRREASQYERRIIDPCCHLVSNG